MAHREAEYEANGHTVKIMQYDEGGDISTWIDGRAGYIEEAMESFTNDSETSDMSLSKKVSFRLKNGYTWGAVKDTLSYMTDCHVYYCSKCNNFYDYNTSVSTGFAGHKCGKCEENDNYCPESEDNSHEDRCLNPRKKHNARVSTKYQCKHCGRKWKTVPTG